MTERTEYIDKKIMLYSTVTLIVTALAVILRTVCMFVSYDAYIGYYKEGVLPSTVNWLCVACAAFFVSAIFTVKPCVKCSDGKESNALVKGASVFAFAGWLCFFVMTFFSASLVSTHLVMIVLTTLCVVASAAFFAMNLKAQKSREVQALCGFGIVIWCLLVIFVSYFDITELLNGPNKINLHMALLSVMLFMINEIRCFVGEINKRFYVFSLTAATFFSGVCSVPTLIFYISSGLDNKYIWHNIVLAGMFIYFLARLVSFTLASGNSGETECTEQNDEPAESEL